MSARNLILKDVSSRDRVCNGAVDRRHTRIVYVRENEDWSHTVTGGEVAGATQA